MIYVSVFMPMPYYFDYYNFIIQFEVRVHDASGFVALSKIALAICSLWVKVNFRGFSISMKNAIGILIGVGHE